MRVNFAGPVDFDFPDSFYAGVVRNLVITIAAIAIVSVVVIYIVKKKSK